MKEKIQKWIRELLGINSHMLDLKLIDINQGVLAGDEKRFEEFLKVIANEYVLLIRRGKNPEAKAMDALYGKLQESYDALHGKVKKQEIDPIILLQNKTQEMIENNSLDK